MFYREINSDNISAPLLSPWGVLYGFQPIGFRDQL